MLIEMYLRGIRPDLISMANAGGEKKKTYEFIPIFSAWCRDVGFPEPVICDYRPKPETTARYREAVNGVADRLRLKLDDVQLDNLSRLYGNMIANETLPGIAFGPKSCSLKWKLEAQEPT